MHPLLLLSLVLAGGLVIGPYLIHRAYRAPRRAARDTPAALGLPYRSVHIPTANGKRLAAWLIPAAGEVAGECPAVVLLHGWGGNAGDMLPFAAPLHRAGYAALLLEARNHGDSDRDGFSSLPRFAEDLEQGLDWIGHQPGIDRTRLALLGHSVGAGATLLAASRRDDIAAVVSIAAFAHPRELMRRRMAAHHIPYRPLGWAVLHYVERTIGSPFDDIAPCRTIRRVRCPVLIMHGIDDRVAPADDARRLYAARRDARTELFLLEGVGHDSREAIQAHTAPLMAFLRRHLDGNG